MNAEPAESHIGDVYDMLVKLLDDNNGALTVDQDTAIQEVFALLAVAQAIVDLRDVLSARAGLS